MAAGLVGEYQRPVLVPMTLANPPYLDEIFGAVKGEGIPVHHFFLKVPEDVLVRRIDGRSVTPGDPAKDERVRAWCKSKIASCVAAADALPEETTLLDGQLTPQELADAVRARVGAEPRP
nr:hypothetical protein [Streptomyces sp. AcE210]